MRRSGALLKMSASGSVRGTTKSGEAAAVSRECLAARTGVAIMDASTLGKCIQVDAATFLDWVYTTWVVDAEGRSLPLRPDARRTALWDDGVTTRIGDSAI
jgi:sarcosine oxidase subunit alpha